MQDPFTKDIFLYEYVYDVSQQKIIDALMHHEISSGCEAVGFFSIEEDQFTVLEFENKRAGQIEKVVMSFYDYMRHYAKNVIIEEDREKFLAHYLDRKYTTSEFSQEIVYRTLRNGKIEYLSGSSCCYEEDGKTYCVLVRRNVTDLIRQEEEKNQELTAALDKANKASQAKNDFLARMSHDMRTPMNAILGMSHLAAEEAKKGLPTPDHINQIEQSSQYLLGVINDILEMGRIESGKTTLACDYYSPEDIFLPVIHMIRPSMEKKKIQFVFDENILGRWNAEYYADEQKVQQMLMNLLNNACKFTQEGGRVELRFSNLSIDKEKCYGVDQIIIEDNGCGMSEAFLENIFEPFEQERLPGNESIPGTGLGLSIARNIARLMGGDITVTSEIGKGSTFTVIFPYHYRILPASEQESKIVPEPAQIERLLGKRVLLAEDNEINAMIAAKLLENKGLTVKLAVNGKEAVEEFKKAPPKTYDFILMDIRMPLMDGLEAARTIRAIERPDAADIPIIAMSANAFEEDRQLSIQSGMNAHLSKPVEPKVLFETLLEYV
ncbi:MAG: ATP-binding protein [Lachnospiraceae bacterium]|nr:ATP-binding protein [Lachnospiraceae bacterium]